MVWGAVARGIARAASSKYGRSLLRKGFRTGPYIYQFGRGAVSSVVPGIGTARNLAYARRVGGYLGGARVAGGVASDIALGSAGLTYSRKIVRGAQARVRPKRKSSVGRRRRRYLYD